MIEKKYYKLLNVFLALDLVTVPLVTVSHFKIVIVALL